MKIKIKSTKKKEKIISNGQIPNSRINCLGGCLEEDASILRGSYFFF